MTFPDPPLIGRPSVRAPAAGSEDGGTAPTSRAGGREPRAPRRGSRPRAVKSIRARRRRTHNEPPPGCGFRLLGEQEYLRLVDLWDTSADLVQAPGIPPAATPAGAVREGIDTSRDATVRARLRRRARLALAAVVGGLAAVLSVASQTSAPRDARHPTNLLARADRHVLPTRGVHATVAAVVDRPRRIASLSRSLRPPQAARRAHRHVFSRPVAPRAAAVVAARHTTTARRGSERQDTTARQHTRRPSAQEVRTQPAPRGVDRSRETADFTFER
jgi:hypothetical protein